VKPHELAIRIRRLTVDDGAEVWRLVRNTKVLDTNSPYLYLLAGAFFGDTSLVAEVDGDLVGFVFALRPPPHPEVVFVWQVGVSPLAQGRRVASRLLDALVQRTAEAGVTHLAASVTPSNAASRSLFQSFARRHGAPCEVSPFLESEQFPRGAHEPEELFRIGPLGAGTPGVLSSTGEPPRAQSSRTGSFNPEFSGGEA